jgi:hypothetical protein
MASAGSNSAGSDGEENKSNVKTIAPTHMSFVRNLTAYSYGAARALSPTSKPGNFFENQNKKEWAKSDDSEEDAGHPEYTAPLGNLDVDGDVEMNSDGDGAASIGSQGDLLDHMPKRAAPAYMFNSSDGGSSGSIEGTDNS